jgi:hypothetical protein
MSALTQSGLDDRSRTDFRRPLAQSHELIGQGQACCREHEEAGQEDMKVTATGYDFRSRTLPAAVR